MNRRTLLGAALLATATGAATMGTARAATQAPYDAKSFAAAQNANKPILVAVHASWCPTCAKQRPIIEQLSKASENKDLLIFIVDFDTQKDIVKGFGVQTQSTLIAFHGKVERDRSTGATDTSAIKALVAKTRA